MNNPTLQIVVTKMIMKASMDIWGSCKSRDLGKWATGSAFPLDYQGNVGLKYLFCKVKDMNRPGNEVYIYSTKNTIDDYIANEIKAKIHPPGTVIFPKIGGAIATNKRRILVKDSAIDNNCLGIIPNKNTDSEWLYHFLSSVDFSRYQSGTSVPSLRQSVIGDIDAPLMPKNIQKEVAIFLTWLKEKSPATSWDNSPPLPSELQEQKSIFARIEHLMVRIEEGRRLRVEAVEEVQRLLRNNLRKIFLDGEFETTVLGKICKTTSGGTPRRNRPDYFKGRIPWLKSGELNDCLITDSEEHITEEALQNSSAKIFPKGVLLIALYGATVGKTGILGIDSSTNQAICALFPQNNVLERDYLHWFLKYKRNDFLNESFGGAQPNISQRLLRKTNIPLPSLPVQRHIVAYLDSLQEKMDELKKLQAETEKEIEELIPSILDKAFKGEL